MGTINPVADVGRRGQRLKPVQKSWRDVEMAKVIVVEPKRLLSPECRRILADVDQYVVHGAVSASHQLRFASAGASVHAPDHALPRTGLRILDEGRRTARPAEMFVEDIGVESAGEEPTIVTKGLRGEDQNVDEVSLFDKHQVMLS